jgi:YD repeat-containing protein
MLERNAPPKPVAPFDVFDLMPDDTPGYMADAWIDCLHWALGDDSGAVQAFRTATGNQWTPARDPLGRMIDAATGVEADFLRQFIVWFNANVWGAIEPEQDVRP